MSRFRAQAPGSLISSPEVGLARAMEAHMIACGLPNPYTKAQFHAMHERLYSGDADYREAHQLLTRMLKARRAIRRAKAVL